VDLLAPYVSVASVETGLSRRVRCIATTSGANTANVLRARQGRIVVSQPTATCRNACGLSLDQGNRTVLYGTVVTVGPRMYICVPDPVEGAEGYHPAHSPNLGQHNPRFKLRPATP
jgi:hypothetical protein